MKMKKFFAICSTLVILVSLLGVVPAGAQSGVTTQQWDHVSHHGRVCALRWQRYRVPSPGG